MRAVASSQGLFQSPSVQRPMPASPGGFAYTSNQLSGRARRAALGSPLGWGWPRVASSARWGQSSSETADWWNGTCSSKLGAQGFLDGVPAPAGQITGVFSVYLKHGKDRCFLVGPRFVPCRLTTWRLCVTWQSHGAMDSQHCIQPRTIRRSHSGGWCRVAAWRRRD